MFEMPNEEKHYNFDNKRQRKHQDSGLAIKDTHALHSVLAIKETTTLLTIKKSEKTTRSDAYAYQICRDCRKGETIKTSEIKINPCSMYKILDCFGHTTVWQYTLPVNIRIHCMTCHQR